MHSSAGATSGGASGSGASSGGGTAKGGAGGGSGGGGGGNNAGTGGGSSTGFALTSPNHKEGAVFASKYTCADAGFSGSKMPELNWTDGPSGTKSYAITFIDVTLTKKTPPDNNGYHWVIYNIPSTVKSLPEALTDAQAKALGASENSAFLGPCPNFGSAPPTGSKTDTYEFTLYALSDATITLTDSGTTMVKNAETKLEGMNLAKTKLSGTSNAASNR